MDCLFLKPLAYLFIFRGRPDRVGKKVGNTHISQDSGKYWEIRLILLKFANIMVQETSKLIFMF
jgi:hypothetical protein